MKFKIIGADYRHFDDFAKANLAYLKQLDKRLNMQVWDILSSDNRDLAGPPFVC